MKRVKSKTLLIALAVALAAICAGGTIAYFSYEDKAHNVISSGSVEIELHEWADTDKTTEFPEDGVKDVMPGTSVTKIVEVENTGDGDAWVRIQVTKQITFEDPEAEADLSLVVLDIDTENWTEKDGWYYYKKALKTGETAEPLFESVTFAGNMSDEYQNCTATVNVVAQAVQTANNGASATEASGWPE